MHVAFCVCDAAPRIEVPTRVLVLMHRREVEKTTATARLALLALPNSEVRVHGNRDAPLDLSDLDHAARRILLLFPSVGATPLTRERMVADPRPVTLVVPDGSWRQAAKIGRRVPGLARAERVTLHPTGETRYRLRAGKRPGGLATFEAISRALGILESEAVAARLDAFFDLMVERTLVTRGVANRNESGEPAAEP